MNSDFKNIYGLEPGPSRYLGQSYNRLTIEAVLRSPDERAVMYIQALK